MSYNTGVKSSLSLARRGFASPRHEATDNDRMESLGLKMMQSGTRQGPFPFQGWDRVSSQLIKTIGPCCGQLTCDRGMRSETARG